MKKIPLIFVFLLSLCLADIGQAATITVDTDLDVLPGILNVCRLRDAIETANTNQAVAGCVRIGSGTDDTIIFDTSAPNFNSNTIVLGSALPSIDEKLIIEGPLGVSLTVDGNGANINTRVFTIDTLTGNKSPASVTIRNLRMTNAVSIFDGGGIHVSPPDTLNLRSCIIDNNEAPSGGGISTWGRTVITDCTISNNTATAAFGGAGVGGGILHNMGTLDITNSTLSGNTSSGQGGGAIYQFFGSVTLNNVTITGNTSQGSSGGGGIFFIGSTLDFQNSIIAGNIDNSGNNHPDCDNSVSNGTLSSGGYNIIGDSTGCAFTANTGDQVGTAGSPIDPLLGPLQDNGGPTFTHALLIGSPAIDAGNPSGCTDHTGALLTSDQRGVSRPQDGDSDGSSICDIGAYEAVPLAITPSWIIEILRDSLFAIDDLDPRTLRNKNAKIPLTNKINATIRIVDQGFFQEALDKLNDDVLRKMNGCAETGFPDKTDWITDCDSQNQVSIFIVEAVELLVILVDAPVMD